MDTTVIVAAGVGCFGVLLVVAIVSAVVARRRERERQEALARWAGQRGWRFVAWPDVDWGRRMPGQNRRGVSLALFGQINRWPVTVAEYSYTTTSTSTVGSGDTQRTSTTTTTHRFVILVAQLRQARPAVAVYRRGTLSKFGRVLFGDRATAIGYEPFDSAFRVAADDPAAVRSVLGRDLVAEHVAGRLPEWSLRGTELLTFREGRIADPDGILAYFGPLLRVADLIETGR